MLLLINNIPMVLSRQTVGLKFIVPSLRCGS